MLGRGGVGWGGRASMITDQRCSVFLSFIALHALLIQLPFLLFTESWPTASTADVRRDSYSVSLSGGLIACHPRLHTAFRPRWQSGASIPMGRGDMSPPNILEVMLYRMSTRVTTTVVGFILTQILCVVSQKSFSFWGTKDLLPGLRLWTPLGSPDPQSSFMPPQ